jgi:hypothetical protein
VRGYPHKLGLLLHGSPGAHAHTICTNTYYCSSATLHLRWMWHRAASYATQEVSIVTALLRCSILYLELQLYALYAHCSTAVQHVTAVSLLCYVTAVSDSAAHIVTAVSLPCMHIAHQLLLHCYVECMCMHAGTGKTSLIKALASHTGRNIVSIPLSRIQTNQVS